MARAGWCPRWPDGTGRIPPGVLRRRAGRVIRRRAGCDRTGTPHHSSHRADSAHSIRYRGRPHRDPALREQPEMRGCPRLVNGSSHKHPAMLPDAPVPSMSEWRDIRPSCNLLQMSQRVSDVRPGRRVASRPAGVAPCVPMGNRGEHREAPRYPPPQTSSRLPRHHRRLPAGGGFAGIHAFGRWPEVCSCFRKARRQE